MPKIIVTSRFLKNEKGNLKNYVRYIATRQGVVIDEKKNFINYLDQRPQSHGLFTESDEKIILDRVAKEVAEHTGTIWTHVVSLKREDAERMGYNTLAAWKDLIQRQLNNISVAQKISLENQRWYAAFHDKETNPHVHIVVYSANPKEGFLTKKGIEQIRSGFANDIYQNELAFLYQKQTQTRDLIKAKTREKMRKLLKNLRQGEINPALTKLIVKLKNQLQTVKGKKVYGYLPKDVKQTINDILKVLASDKNITEMYKLWSDYEIEKHETYSGRKFIVPPIEQQNAFKSIKNEIIRQVDTAEINFENSEIVSENIPQDRNKKSAGGDYEEKKKFCTKQNDSVVKTAFRLLDSLGKIIADDYENKFKDHLQTETKLKRMIRQKKLALGMKQEQENAYGIELTL